MRHVWRGKDFNLHELFNPKRALVESAPLNDSQKKKSLCIRPNALSVYRHRLTVYALNKNCGIIMLYVILNIVSTLLCHFHPSIFKVANRNSYMCYGLKIQ